MNQQTKKALPILFFTLLLDMIGTGMIVPIIPVIFTDPASSGFLLHGYTESMQYFIAGLITALFGLMQFLAAPILGELSDVYGRRKLLILGVGVLAVSQFVFGFGIAIGAIWLILVSRAIAGLAGANFSIAQATIADVSEPHERAKNFGLMGAAFGIGFILGPLLSGWIAAWTGSVSAPFFCAGVLGFLNLLFVWRYLPETRVVSKERKHAFHILKGIHNIRAAFEDKDALPVYGSTFLYFSGFTFFTSFIGILLLNRFGFTAASIGTYFGIVGVCVVVTQLFILPILSRAFPERRILRYAIPVVASAMFAYPFLPAVGIFAYLLIPIFAVPQALTMANLTALVSKSVSADKQGAALGINGSLIALSQGVIPIIAGLMTGLLGLRLPFITGALFVFISWSVLFLTLKRK